MEESDVRVNVSLQVPGERQVDAVLWEVRVECLATGDCDRMSSMVVMVVLVLVRTMGTMGALGIVGMVVGLLERTEEGMMAGPDAGSKGRAPHQGGGQCGSAGVSDRFRGRGKSADPDVATGVAIVAAIAPAVSAANAATS